MDRSELREKLIAAMKINPPANLTQFSRWCKKHNYYDYVVSHTSYLLNNCTFSERIYHVFYNLTERPKCKQCNLNDVKFTNIRLGYQKYCSTRCVARSREVREKFEKTNFTKYGVRNVSQVEEFIEKRKQTCLERFGETTNLKTEETKQKIKQTNLEKYGHVCNLHSDEGKLKVEQTNLEKYGFKNAAQSEVIRDKIGQSRLQFFFKRLLNSDRLKDHYEPLFTLEDYKGVSNHSSDNKRRQNVYYPFRCKVCGTEFVDDINCGSVPRCPVCYPFYRSNGEQELAEFCRQYYPNLQTNTKAVIAPNELDIYIPDINLAVEYNGLYWHSEFAGGKGQYDHQNKLTKCLQKEINLIQIFEDEWLEKRSIVENVLLAKFGLIQNKILASDCQLTVVSSKIGRDFYNSNHIDGFKDGTTIGLTYNNELVSTITVGEISPHNLEVYRFCSKLSTEVVGAFDTLLSNIIKYMQPRSIVVFVDLRFNLGEEYKKAGFNFLEITEPNCSYLLDFGKKISRTQFHEFGLKLYATECENMQLNGYDRIWDCGRIKYELIT